MTPDEIRSVLARGWIDQRDRKRLEAQLARMSGASQSASQAPTSHASAARSSAPAGQNFETIAIHGSPAFVGAVRSALAKLRRTSSWENVGRIGSITEVHGTQGYNGYCTGNAVSIDRAYWRNAGGTNLVRLIAHEACHAAHRDGNSTPENERRAYLSEAKALREVGAPAYLVRASEKNAASPPHFRPGATPARLGTPVAADAAEPRKLTAGRMLNAIFFGK